VDSKPDRELESGQPTDTGDTRRDVARKLGKFAAYAAPFTVLALTSKAATGSGPGPHLR
jgi:hypothetical protein